MAISTKAGNIRKGQYIEFKGRPFQVTYADFKSHGRGSAFMRVKMRDVASGSIQEFTYKSNDSVDILEVNSIQMQYLYHDATEVVFMNERTYEQFSVPIALLEGKELALTAEVKAYVLELDDVPLGVTLPPKVKLTVTTAVDAVAGNTVGQARKEIELETGLKIQAPLFIKEGESVLVDTQTLEYAGRTND